ncbi:MAG: LuxR C-terminal-related transcriptional regulator [Rikenellaceae bacterium]
MNHIITNRSVPLIIILTPNTLSSVGLREMLSQILPFALIKVCNTIEELLAEKPTDIFHIFISSQLLIENIQLLDKLRPKLIALTNGSANTSALREFHQINIQQGEAEIMESIKAMHTHAHGSQHPTLPPPNEETELLSPREREVTKLLVEGLINKEIAARLDIGVTTVITHRKNIFEKLGIRSIAGLTIYAIMKRYVDI